MATRQTDLLRLSDVVEDGRGMSFIRSVIPFVAALLVALATTEIVFCSECSPESCQFSKSTSSQHGPISHSGDECLCCCAHLLVIAPSTIRPAKETLPAVEATVPPLPFTTTRPEYHPPKI